MRPRMWPALCSFLLALSACRWVSGFSVVNDTAGPLQVRIELSCSVRLEQSSDCHGDGATMPSPVSTALEPGARLCVEGPADETRDYRLTDRVQSLTVTRNGHPCLYLSGAELASMARFDGRNAAAAVALHVGDAACPP